MLCFEQSMKFTADVCRTDKYTMTSAQAKCAIKLISSENINTQKKGGPGSRVSYT